MKKTATPCRDCKYGDFCEYRDSRLYPLLLDEHASCRIYISALKRRPERAGRGRRIGSHVQ